MTMDLALLADDLLPSFHQAKGKLTLSRLLRLAVEH